MENLPSLYDRNVSDDSENAIVNFGTFIFHNDVIFAHFLHFSSINYICQLITSCKLYN